MGYVSRRYLKEKYEKIKSEVENHLKVLDNNQPDEVSEDDVCYSFIAVRDNMQAFLKELEKGLDD